MTLKDVKDKFFVLTQEKRVELGITQDKDLPNKIESREIVIITDITKRKRKDKIFYEVVLQTPLTDELNIFTEYLILRGIVSSEKEFEDRIKGLLQEVDRDLASYIKRMRIWDLLAGDKVQFDD